jgi:DNA polymerase I-like protein with 3'-5' exonuclease and polymerase domains
MMCNKPEDLNLEGVDLIAIDLETYDPNLKTKGTGAIRQDGFITGVAVKTMHETVYFALQHSDTHKTETEKKEFWDKFSEKILLNKKITKVFHNAMYDVCWIRAVTGKMIEGRIVDTMIAASVIDENRFKYSLDSLAKDYLDEEKYKYDLQQKTLEWSGGTVKDPMTNMHKLPASIVKEYAKQDVNLTYKLWKLFDKKLDEVLYTNEKKESKTCRNIFELETELFLCLVDMKFKGVRIDVLKLRLLGEDLRKKRDDILEEIKRETGLDIQIWAASSIKSLLEKRNITDYKKTPKSKMPSLPKDYLRTHKDKFLRKVAEAREYDKAANTFVDGLLSFVYKGRIHADVNQIRGDGGGTVTGRFSMTNPNLQQIPSKGDIGKKMREVFLPEPGHDWGSFDYSQQEPRIVVHYALIHKCKGTEELKEKFDKDKADFHQIVADMAKISRKQAKTINLGLFYGMGKNKLRVELGLEQEGAKKLFDDYHRKVPFVKEISEKFMEFSQDLKLIYTLEDRFCRFNRYETVDKRWINLKWQEWDKDITYIDKETKKERKGKYIDVKLLTEEEARAQAAKKYNEKMEKKWEQLEKHVQDEEFKEYYVPAFTYKALNRMVQGSAADMTKKAMVLLHKKGIIPHIQIHDELCLSVKDNMKDTVKNIMENAVPLEINNKVDFESGPNWGTTSEE